MTWFNIKTQLTVGRSNGRFLIQEQQHQLAGVRAAPPPIIQKGDRVNIVNTVNKPRNWNDNFEWDQKKAQKATVTHFYKGQMLFVTDNGARTWRAVNKQPHKRRMSATPDSTTSGRAVNARGFSSATRSGENRPRGNRGGRQRTGNGNNTRGQQQTTTATTTQNRSTFKGNTEGMCGTCSSAMRNKMTIGSIRRHLKRWMPTPG